MILGICFFIVFPLKILRLPGLCVPDCQQNAHFRRKGNSLQIVISKMKDNPKESLMLQTNESRQTALSAF
jgi:hypothetical protein